jgi:hypothetical protein
MQALGLHHVSINVTDTWLDPGRQAFLRAPSGNRIELDEPAR